MEDSRYRPPEADLPLVVPDSTESTPAAPLDAEVQHAPQKVAEQELATEAIKKQPVIAFEHAAKAAEENKALEKVYELRHEVKDESMPAATHIGQVLAGLQQRQPGLAAQAPPPPVEPPLPRALVTPPRTQTQPPLPRPSLYRRAIVGGFLAGALLLILYILLSLLF